MKINQQINKFNQLSVSEQVPYATTTEFNTFPIHFVTFCMEINQYRINISQNDFLLCLLRFYLLNDTIYFDFSCINFGLCDKIKIITLWMHCKWMNHKYYAIYFNCNFNFIEQWTLDCINVFVCSLE